MHEFILSQFVTLWDEYEAARALIPKGSLAEVAYADLARDPSDTVRGVYETLGLGGWEERVRARVESELGRAVVSAHKVNAFEPMPVELEQLVAKRWERFTKAWGYEW